MDFIIFGEFAYYSPRCCFCLLLALLSLEFQRVHLDRSAACVHCVLASGSFSCHVFDFSGLFFFIVALMLILQHVFFSFQMLFLPSLHIPFGSFYILHFFEYTACL